jgi:hypothetical protein
MCAKDTRKEEQGRRESEDKQWEGRGGYNQPYIILCVRRSHSVRAQLGDFRPENPTHKFLH